MQLGRCFSTGILAAIGAVAQSTADVGSGAPSAAISQTFIEAWSRNGFNRLVGAPSGNVTRYGTTGLIQQFPSATTGGGTFALIKPDSTEAFNVRQVLDKMFSYYGSVTVTTAGYPTTDTLDCVPLKSAALANHTCQYQTFSNKYVLFVYDSPLLSGGSANFATKDPFYTKWAGIGTLGPAVTAETQFTSTFGTAATVQQYDQGAIYNFTAGALNGRIFAVKEPVYDLYFTNLAHTGSLGVPTGEELLLPNGMRQQAFEGGAIQYDPATGIAVLRPPVSRVVLSPIGAVHLNVGETVAAQVTLYGTDGGIITDRSITWNTSNGSVVQIQATGATAVIKGFGGGTATVTVTSEGKVSQSLVVSVTALCCQIGEGAPNTTVQKAFQDAVTRNRLSVQVPAQSPALRVGKGYVQTLLGTGMPPATYLVTVSDGSSAGYVVAGAILTQYQAMGGPSGVLGYAQSDATQGGRQSFQQGTLAGSPAQLVSGGILAKWGAQGYETGAMGLVTGAAAAFQTFRGSSGIVQPFQNALIISMTSGPQLGQTFVVTGPVLAQYTANGGPTGALGAPTADERTLGSLRQQDFEGGVINYPPGSTQATVVKTPRQPLVTTTPAIVISGTTVHLSIGGFNDGTSVRVSQTGTTDFVVKVPNGSYTWDSYIPPTAANASITVRAVEIGGTASAQAAYTIKSAAVAAFGLSIVSGDQQAGAPGSVLAQPLTVVVKDSVGTPLSGQTVTFAASTGAQITPASAITAADGTASAILRMPSSSGITLATATSEHLVVTFSARASPLTLANFPNLTQAVDGLVGKGPATIREKGALLTATAAILRYYQIRNDLPQPNGLADPVVLNQFLKNVCLPDCDGFVALGTSTQQIVNLWRVGGFVSNNVDVRVEQPSVVAVRDLVAGGSPVLLALSLGAAGVHFVAATGIASDGSLAIADPDPNLGQTNLTAYLNGFTSGSGAAVKGMLAGAVRLLPQAAASTGFVVAATAPVTISSLAGACGATLQLSDALYFRACDGASALYQLDIAAQGAFDATFTPYGSSGREVLSGAGASSSLLERNGSQWIRSPVQVKFDPSGVVNAASSTSDIAPGGAISIYGAGLASASAPTTVTVNSVSAFVYIATPFQVNVQIPPDVNPGPALVNVSSGGGTLERPVTVQTVAPAIFSVGPGQAAVTNRNGSLNTPTNPVLRGSAVVIYGTGFGATVGSGVLKTTATPVTAMIGNTEIPTSFAGLTPGFVGLYQVNVIIPNEQPPGLSLPLTLKQRDAVSNTVTVSIQ